MAIMDVNLMFTATTNDTLVISSTSTASSKVVDLTAIGAAVYGQSPAGAPGGGRDVWVGSGEVPKILCEVYGSPVGTSTPTLNFQVQGNFTASSAADANWVTMVETGAITTANLSTSSINAAINVLNIDLPGLAPGQKLPQYLRLNVILPSGTAVTTGSYFAGIVLSREQWNAKFVSRNFSA